MLRHARRPALALGLALAACLLTPHPVQAHEPHLELAEVAWTSDVVMLGTVRDIRVYESTRTAAILTDITFADVEVVHASERAAAVGDEVTLTFLGGVLADGRGLSVCDQPHFTRGERWMLFALHDGTRYMNPFVGGPQGMFRIVTDAATGESYPVTAGGSAVVSVDQGALRGTPEVISIDHGIAVCAAPEREHSVTPVAMEGALSASTRRVETEYLPLTLTEFRREVEGILAGAPPETRIFPGRDAEPVAENLKARRPVKSSRTASPEHAGAHEPRGTLCACGYHDLYMSYLNGPIRWTATSTDRTPLSSVILPSGF